LGTFWYDWVVFSTDYFLTPYTVENRLEIFN